MQELFIGGKGVLDREVHSFQGCPYREVYSFQGCPYYREVVSTVSSLSPDVDEWHRVL